MPLEEEVEDWLYATRERLADHARYAHLRLATGAFDAGAVEDAVRHAERALGVARSSDDDAGRLAALVGLLRRGGSPRARDAEREALELGIVLERADDGAGAARPASAQLPSTHLRLVRSSQLGADPHRKKHDHQSVL